MYHVEKKYLNDLLGSYQGMKDMMAFKDLSMYLDDLKDKAMLACKTKDSPEGRATWQLIEKIYSHIDNLEGEVMNNKEG
jgi:hypothetical protein